jgi:hypothetical protein
VEKNGYERYGVSIGEEKKREKKEKKSTEPAEDVQFMQRSLLILNVHLEIL